MAKKRKPNNGKPELSDGYVKIANELWQALIDYDLTAAQMKLIAVIIRETYGYNRKSKDLSVSYLANATHQIKRNTQRALNDLIEKKVVREYGEYSPRASREIGINKYYLEWSRGGQNVASEVVKMTGGQNVTSETVKMSPLEVVKMSPKPIHIKDTLKDNTPAAKNTYWDDMFAD